MTDAAWWYRIRHAYWLDGGAGADVIDGGFGADMLLGGTGQTR